MPLTYRYDGALRETPRHEGLNATAVPLGAGILFPATETVWGLGAVVALLDGAVVRFVEAPGARAA